MLPRKFRLGSRQVPLLVLCGTVSGAMGLFALDAAGARSRSPKAAATTRAAASRGVPSLRVLDWSLWNVARNYLDPDRIRPEEMIAAALEEVERQVPEVIVSLRDDGRSARVRVSTAERTFDLPPDVALWDVGLVVADVLSFVREHAHLDEDRAREVEYAVVNGALATLDPHSMLLPPRVFEDMKTSTQGSFGGLGIEIGMREGFITVLRVIDGNPASRVDMRPGDRIVQIDGDSTVTMTLDEAVKLLRGPPGTTVSVYVMREGLPKPKRLDITRAIIKLDSVVGTVVEVPGGDGTPQKVGVVQIPRNFAQTTPRELHDKLEAFRREQVRALVLDLRGNPGGLLASAVAVADTFLSSGMIVATVGRDPDARDESYASERYDFDPVPLVVLVDQFSASASEIVAGSLANLGRAVVLGRQTFGKGTVQALYERRYGEDELALKLTIAQYLVAGDVSIQGVGVTPHVTTVPAYIGKDHVEYFGMRRFARLREADFRRAITGMNQAATQRTDLPPLYYLAPGSEGAESKGPKDDKSGDAARARMLLEDPEIRIGATVALTLPPPTAPVDPGRLAPTIRNLAASEEKRIVDSLAAVGIDWAPPPQASAGGQVALRAVLTDGTDILGDAPTVTVEAGKTSKVTLAVTNVSQAPAYRVRAITDSDDPYLDEREFLFGRIEPGETRTQSIEVAVAEHERSHMDRVLFSVHAAQDVTTAPGSATYFDIVAKGLARPAFAVGYQIVDDPALGKEIRGNGDGRLQVGERVQLRVDVRNRGLGDAIDTWVTLRNRSGSPVFLHTGRERLETIEKNAQKTATLDLELREMPKGGTAEFRILVSDNKVAEVLVERLRMPVAEEAPPADTASAPRAVEVGAGGTIFASADLLRPVARLEAPATLRATGAFGDAIRVRWNGRLGFVRRSDVTEGGGRSRKVKAETILSITPPRVEIDDVPLRTDANHVRIRGRATDDRAVRDVYVTVYNPIEDRFEGGDKVFYRAADDPSDADLSFETEVPLAPGANRIEIHAREDDELEGTKVLWVFSTRGWAEAHAKRRARQP